MVELDCTADWDFPLHNPNPEDISFLHAISKTAQEVNADIAIGIDGDGDRIGVVDGKGREVFSDKLGLLLARWICKKNPGRSVVIDVKSTGLFFDDEVLNETNTEIVMWKTGHSYIKAKVAEVNAIAGFEKSGHWFLNKPYGRGYDDAVISSVQLLKMLEESPQTLAEMIDALPITWQSPTLSPYCADDQKYGLVDEMVEVYKADKEAGVKIGGLAIKDLVTVNGVRFILEDNSWGLLRASSNKPCLVLVSEARSSEDQMHDIMDHIRERIEKTGKVGEYDQEMPPRPGKG